MTPAELRAILAASTQGRWVVQNYTAVPKKTAGIDCPSAEVFPVDPGAVCLEEDAAEIALLHNVAPLLLRVWEEASATQSPSPGLGQALRALSEYHYE